VCVCPVHLEQRGDRASVFPAQESLPRIGLSVDSSAIHTSGQKSVRAI
jgi:hypothetical protein